MEDENDGTSHGLASRPELRSCAFGVDQQVIFREEVSAYQSNSGVVCKGVVLGNPDGNSHSTDFQSKRKIIKQGINREAI